MTMLRVWHALIYIGDGAVLLPCAVLIFAWLIATPATRRTGWWWLGAALLVGGGVALSKLLYMATGWHPAGWNFIGLSGHAALSFLFWPSVAALVTRHYRTGLRVVAVALGVGLALAITVSSWVLRDHSLVELVLGALWGVLGAAAFLPITWRRNTTRVPSLRTWMTVSLLLLLAITYRHRFPSAGVLGWVASQLNGHTTVYTRDELGSWAQLSDAVPEGLQVESSSARARGSPRVNR
jgi:hypothetical protein